MHLIVYWRRQCVPYLRARYRLDERGSPLVEYALLAALIAVVALAAVTFFGTRTSGKLSTVASAVG